MAAAAFETTVINPFARPTTNRVIKKEEKLVARNGSKNVNDRIVELQKVALPIDIFSVIQLENGLITKLPKDKVKSDKPSAVPDKPRLACNSGNLVAQVPKARLS